MMKQISKRTKQLIEKNEDLLVSFILKDYKTEIPLEKIRFDDKAYTYVKILVNTDNDPYFYDFLEFVKDIEDLSTVTLAKSVWKIDNNNMKSFKLVLKK